MVGELLDIIKMKSKGQITIPVEIRKEFKLEDGDSIAFIKGEDGKLYVVKKDKLKIANGY